MQFKDSWRWQGMVAVLLIGFAAFIHGVNNLILWADEAWTVYASDPDVALAETYSRVIHDIHPPLFFVELHLWREFTGSSVFEMRYFSILLFMLTLALLYRLGRELYSPAAGILAGAFVALNDLERIFAQEVRHYPQQQVMTVLVMVAYWRFWQKPTRRRGALLAVAGAALLWSYYWGGFVLLGLACHALLTRPRQWRAVVPVFAAMGLLFVPWLPHLYSQYTDLDNGLQYSLNNSWASAVTLSRQLMGTPSAMWLLLLAAGVPRALRPRSLWRPSPATLLPAVVIGVVVSTSVILNPLFASLFTRSLAIIIPSVALLIGHTLSQFRRPEGGVMLGVLGAVCLTLTSAQPVIRATWDEVASYLAQHTTGDDVLLMEMNYRERKYLEEMTLRFYLDRANPEVRVLSTEEKRVKDPAGFAATLDDQLADENGLWVVKLGWPYYDLRPDLLARGFVETAPIIHPWPNFGAQPIEVWRFDRPTADAASALNTFGDTMRLLRASVQAGNEWVTVNLLWSPGVAPGRNITVSAFLMAESGVLVRQHDSYPMDGDSPTLDWVANGLYFDSHVLALDDVPPGTYQVGLQVYAFTDESFSTIEPLLPAANALDDCGAQPDCQFIILDTVQVR